VGGTIGNKSVTAVVCS